MQLHIEWWMPLLAVVALKIILNLPSAWYLRRISNIYSNWLKHDDAIIHKILLHSKHRTIAVCKRVGIDEQFGHYDVRMYASYLHSRTNLFASQMPYIFEEAIGVYYSRAIDAINPLYWISLIVYAPSKILASIGVKSNTIISKLFQWIYWLSGIVLSMLWIFARPTLINWLTALLSQFR